MAVEPQLTKVEVPTLEVGGYWDQEDMWGPQAEYAALKPHDAKHEVFLVLGPWNHGGWAPTTRHLGVLDFGAATGDQYRKTIEAPFFDFYLKGRPGFASEGHGELPDGREHVGKVRFVAAEGRRDGEEAVSASRRRERASRSRRVDMRRRQRRMWRTRQTRSRIVIGRSSRRMGRVRSGGRGLPRIRDL